MTQQSNIKTLSALEFDSLLDVLAQLAETSLGRQALQNLAPLPDKATANRENDRVWNIQKYLDKEGSFDFYWFKHIEEDFFDYKERHPVMEAVLLYTTAKTMQEAAANQQMLEVAGEENPEYLELAGLLDHPEWIANDILDSIDSDGAILDSASPELARLRSEYRKSRAKINSSLRRFFSQADYPDFVQDDFISIRNDRAVIPIKVEKKNRFKGIIHDRSRSGDSVYFEPMEVVEHNNALANIRADIRLEEARVLAALTSALYSNWDGAISVFKNTAYLESLVARARLASMTDSVRPKFAGPEVFEIISGRHPLIDQRLRGLRASLQLDDEYSSVKVVPVDIKFSKEHQILVVTGPNAGGKTVALKTAGLLALMAQSGIHVPATSYTAPFFKTITADIGDSQDIHNHLSSFSSHLYWLRRVLQNLELPSLILVDEIAAATDPGEGSALAMATLEYLRDLESYVMASTHLEALKAFAHSQNGMENCSVEFNPETLKPTYNLLYGLPGKSNALETAKEMKLPDALLERAHYYMGDEGASISEIVGKMQEKLTELRAEKDDVAKERARMEKARLHYIDKLDKAQEEANQEIGRIRKEWKEYRKAHDKSLQESLALARSNAAEEEVRQKMKDSINQREKEFEALKLNKKVKKPRDVEKGPLTRGQSVAYIGTGQTGNVDKDWDGGKSGVAVNFGGKRMTIPRESLRTVSSREKKERSDGGVQIRVNTEQKSPERELVLVGERVQEAIIKLDRFLDDSLINSYETVMVVHGHGTGALRNAVVEHLKSHNMVVSWRPATQAEGGTAKTVVTLNS